MKDFPQPDFETLVSSDLHPCVIDAAASHELATANMGAATLGLRRLKSRDSVWFLKITGHSGPHRSAVCKPLLQGLPLKEVAIGRLNLDESSPSLNSMENLRKSMGRLMLNHTQPCLDGGIQNVEPKFGPESPIQSSRRALWGCPTLGC